jgi:hypothetical protein
MAGVAFTVAPTLNAISLGAVFMGALTYIGNAPNFMTLRDHDHARREDAELLWLHVVVGRCAGPALILLSVVSVAQLWSW